MSRGGKWIIFERLPKDPSKLPSGTLKKLFKMMLLEKSSLKDFAII
jgi:hypothetical protein